MAETKDTTVTPGIVYLSRIPPFMKPMKIKTMFSQYGEVGRLFLQPEDPLVRKRRKKSGGNGRKLFTEGWVEFKDKKIAKAVANTLNNTNLGGKKRFYYHDDIWNVKYLPRFKWGHISEKLAYEKAAREQRMRVEISQVKKETSFYLDNVSKGKAINAMEKRKKRKLEKQDGTIEEVESSQNHTNPKKFKNIQKQETRIESNKASEESGNKFKSSLLSKIFSNG